ncbi:MAG: flagellar basal-body rod protein FlgF [Pseudomonadota bacterium]
MDTGVISAAFGALSQERNLEVIANNLANADTTGFKRDRARFADFLHPATDRQPLPDPARGGPAIVPVGFGANWSASRVRMTGAETDLLQGSTQQTGNTLDLAIEGSGFFRLQTPQGIRYTRRGNFTLDRNRLLVSQEGYPVLDTNNQKITLGEGTAVIASDGTIGVGGQTAGKIGLAQFPQGARLEKMGDAMFAASGDPGAPSLPYEMRQGSLENSNVSSIEEMVGMLDALRRYEAHQRVLQAYGQMDARSVEIAELR